MIEFIKVCGWAGVLCLFSTFLILAASILVTCLAKSRKGLAALAVVALLPLLLGAMGTAAGCSHVARASGRADSPNPVMIQHGRKQAWYTTYLGLGCTMSLLVVISIATTIKGRAEPSVRR